MYKMVEEIVFLPKKFENSNNSMFSLLQETGYFESYELVNEENISKQLLQNKDCVNSWLKHSEDKRAISTWYFRLKENKKYEVGYFPAETGMYPKEYADPIEACAVFIKGEIEEIRTS